MKRLILFFTLIASPVFACPNLTGTYISTSQDETGGQKIDMLSLDQIGCTQLTTKAYHRTDGGFDVQVITIGSEDWQSMDGGAYKAKWVDNTLALELKPTDTLLEGKLSLAYTGGGILQTASIKLKMECQEPLESAVTIMWSPIQN